MASAAARERYARKNEEDELERAFRTIDKKGDDKIDSDELNQLFLALGHKAKRGEVEDMIWEVDEDCDGCISWLEFRNLYTRGRDDKTGYEPRGLFNVVEFVMNDKEGAGFITLEEAMQIMYLRYGRCAAVLQDQAGVQEEEAAAAGGRAPAGTESGEGGGRRPAHAHAHSDVHLNDAALTPCVRRALLDAQLEEVFGTSDLNSGKILTLTEFLHCLHASQVKQLLNRVTAKTYKAPPPTTRKR